MIQIIPAIDLIDGKCVRLDQGDFRRQRSYDADPLDMAKRFADAGLQRLHLVDLDGARDGSSVHFDVLEQIASETSLRIDFSGGIRTQSEVKRALDAGATWVSVGSVAQKDPAQFTEWIQAFGAGRFLLAADAANNCIAVNAWQELSDTDVCGFLSGWMSRGIMQAFCTSIAFDGMLKGPDFLLYDRIRRDLPELELIASGGVRNMADVEALEALGCAGVIVGKALYEGGISLSEVAQMQIL